MKLFTTLITLLTCLAQAQDYHRDIAPIFRTYCAGCHNDADLDSDFSMETYAKLRKGGEKGDPLNADALMRKKLEATGKGKMPPKDEAQLPPEEMATLKKWIAAGAPGPVEDVSLFKSLAVPKIPAGASAKQPVTGAAFSPDGTLLAVALGTSVELRSAADGTVVTTSLSASRFSPNPLNPLC